MSSEIRKITYNNIRSNQYVRSYANTSFVSMNANGDVVIDLAEEYAPPNVITVQNRTGEQFYPSYEHEDAGVLRVTREMKHSVVIPKEQAIQLAKLLFNITGEGQQ